MVSKIDRKAETRRRHDRVRNKISGTPERPRLCIYRSNNNLFAQIVDDVNGVTLTQASTLDKTIKIKLTNVLFFLPYHIRFITLRINHFLKAQWQN